MLAKEDVQIADFLETLAGLKWLSKEDNGDLAKKEHLIGVDDQGNIIWEGAIELSICGPESTLSPAETTQFELRDKNDHMLSWYPQSGVRNPEGVTTVGKTLRYYPEIKPVHGGTATAYQCLVYHFPDLSQETPDDVQERIKKLLHDRRA